MDNQTPVPLAAVRSFLRLYEWRGSDEEVEVKKLLTQRKALLKSMIKDGSVKLVPRSAAHGGHGIGVAAR